MMEWAPVRPKTSLGLRETDPKDNNKKQGLLKKVKSSPLLRSFGSQPPRTPSRPSSCTSTPPSDVPTISVALEPEEQLQESRPKSNMAQITKDSLDRIFVELKSK
jgi:hypothetical protein